MSPAKLVCTGSLLQPGPDAETGVRNNQANLRRIAELHPNRQIGRAVYLNQHVRPMVLSPMVANPHAGQQIPGDPTAIPTDQRDTGIPLPSPVMPQGTILIPSQNGEERTIFISSLWKGRSGRGNEHAEPILQPLETVQNLAHGESIPDILQIRRPTSIHTHNEPILSDERPPHCCPDSTRRPS